MVGGETVIDDLNVPGDLSVAGDIYLGDSCTDELWVDAYTNFACDVLINGFLDVNDGAIIGSGVMDGLDVQATANFYYDVTFNDYVYGLPAPTIVVTSIGDLPHSDPWYARRSLCYVYLGGSSPCERDVYVYGSNFPTDPSVDVNIPLFYDGTESPLAEDVQVNTSGFFNVLVTIESTMLPADDYRGCSVRAWLDDGDNVFGTGDDLWASWPLTIMWETS